MLKIKTLGSNQEITTEKSKSLRFLYNTFLGRIVLKVLYNKWVSKLVGIILGTHISKIMINNYIKKNNIDMARFEKKDYYSFNDFFTRKIKSFDKPKDLSAFIANCDSKISIYDISKDLLLDIKNSKYSIRELIDDNELAQKYENGICIIYRLEPQDYHHYIYIDDGNLLMHKKIQGKLHTVNPIVYDKYKVFVENTREVSLLDTKRFGKIVQIEVGALCVGKINNKNNKLFKRFEEKGFFEFGGSTIIHLIEKDMVSINPQIKRNTRDGYETLVKIGQVIGKRVNKSGKKSIVKKNEIV